MVLESFPLLLQVITFIAPQQVSRVFQLLSRPILAVGSQLHFSTLFPCPAPLIRCRLHSLPHSCLPRKQPQLAQFNRLQASISADIGLSSDNFGVSCQPCRWCVPLPTHLKLFSIRLCILTLWRVAIIPPSAWTTSDFPIPQRFSNSIRSVLGPTMAKISSRFTVNITDGRLIKLLAIAASCRIKWWQSKLAWKNSRLKITNCIVELDTWLHIVGWASHPLLAWSQRPPFGVAGAPYSGALTSLITQQPR